MNFSYFSNFASSGALCRKKDFLRLINSPFVKQMIAEYRAGNKEAKKRLPAFNFHAHFPAGKRKSSDAIPSGMFMLDCDHCTEEEMKQIIDIAIPAEDQRATSPILLVHITPSGKGVRIVAKATQTGVFATCRSISDYQHALAQLLKCEHKLDEVVTDLARLSFVPQAEDVLYLSDRLFTDQAEVKEFAASVPVQHASFANAPSAGPVIFPESEQTTFDGVPLSEIFRQYIEITGGVPQEGGRNSRYYAAARDLRYICDFNPKTIAAFLPSVGLPASEVFQLCASACQSVRSSVNPAPPTVMRAIRLARAMMEEEDAADVASENEDSANSVPDGSFKGFVPLIARDFISTSPRDFQEAVMLSLLPIIGTLATKVRAKYIDGVVHSPSFFTVVSSEQASGKSFARRLNNTLLTSLMEEDARQHEIERQFEEELRQKKNAKEQPKPPRVKIRIIPATISVAKLLKRLDCADGEHLFTYEEEMDTLVKSNKAGTWSQKNELYREGFDNTKYGQDYMSDSSYNANVNVYYNLLVLGTPRQTDRFFSDVENGLLSRCCIATIPDQFGADMPEFKPLDANALLRIEHAVKQLREAKGEYDLSFVHPVLKKWYNGQRIIALKENNRARDIFRRRSAVIGFRAVLAFAPLYDLDKQKNRDRLSEFAVHVADIVLRNQLEFAGERLNAIINKDAGTSSGRECKSRAIYHALPTVFTSKMLLTELRARGMNYEPRKLIHKWKMAKLVEPTENKGEYRKTE